MFLKYRANLYSHNPEKYCFSHLAVMCRSYSFEFVSFVDIALHCFNFSLISNEMFNFFYVFWLCEFPSWNDHVFINGFSFIIFRKVLFIKARLVCPSPGCLWPMSIFIYVPVLNQLFKKLEYQPWWYSFLLHVACIFLVDHLSLY